MNEKSSFCPQCRRQLALCKCKLTDGPQQPGADALGSEIPVTLPIGETAAKRKQETTVAKSDVQYLHGNATEMLKRLPKKSIQSCISSIPYWMLRDYGVGPQQIGLEAEIDEYVEKIVNVYRQVWRVLKPDGVCFLNIGDKFITQGSRRSCGPAPKRCTKRFRRTNSLAPKSLAMIPSRVALALQEDGWIVRNEITILKTAGLPESPRDRCRNNVEKLFLLAKQDKYFFDNDPLRMPYKSSTLKAGPALARKWSEGRRTIKNPRFHEIGPVRGCVWEIPPASQKVAGGHPAPMSLKLAVDCVLCSTRKGDTVLDPFGGSGTTAVAAVQYGRKAILIDLSAEYLEIARKRVSGATSA